MVTRRRWFTGALVGLRARPACDRRPGSPPTLLVRRSALPHRHPDQAAAWQGSRHARSAASPLYLAMRAWAAADAGEAVAERCVACHTVALADGGRLEAVSCEVCHQGVRTGDLPGALSVDRGDPVAARRPTPGAPHPVEVVLVHWRAPEPLFRRFGLTAEPDYAPVTMARAVRSLG